jgi:hypothetical protein
MMNKIFIPATALLAVVSAAPLLPIVGNIVSAIPVIAAPAPTACVAVPPASTVLPVNAGGVTSRAAIPSNAVDPNINIGLNLPISVGAGLPGVSVGALFL